MLIFIGVVLNKIH